MFPTDRRSYNSPAIESLEPRRHLSADAPVALAASSAPSFAARFNFQPETATSVPAGYRADIGRAYARRANGLSYGFSGSSESLAADTNSSRSPDERFDTSINLSSGRSWSVKVPNGDYFVRVFAGRANATGADYRVRVEGQPLLRGTPETDFYWIEGTTTVAVTDGRLTLTRPAGTDPLPLNFVEIAGIVPAPSTPGVHIDWSTDAGLAAPFGRVEPGVTRVGQKLYVLGGFTSGYTDTSQQVTILDLPTRTFSRGTDIPAAAADTHAGIASDGRYIYSIAGQIGTGSATRLTSKSFRYDTQTGTWGTLPDLPVVRIGGSAAVTSGFLHYFGGNDSTRIVSQREHWKLDLSDPAARWQAAAPLPAARDHMGVTVVDGNIYALGGEQQHALSYVQFDNTFVYSPRQDRWGELARMPVAAGHFEGNLVSDGKRLFVLGGETAGQESTRAVRAYVLGEDRWETYAPLPNVAKGGASWITGNRLYYFNGDQVGGEQPTRVFEGIIG